MVCPICPLSQTATAPLSFAQSMSLLPLWSKSLTPATCQLRPVRTASMTQVRQPIYGNSVGRWLPYKDMLAPLLKELDLPRLAPELRR
jgi:hypothetical protein